MRLRLSAYGVRATFHSHGTPNQCRSLYYSMSGYIPKVTSKKASMDGAPRFMSPPARKACHVCGAQFVPTVGAGGSGKFCTITLTAYPPQNVELTCAAIWTKTRGFPGTEARAKKIGSMFPQSPFVLAVDQANAAGARAEAVRASEGAAAMVVDDSTGIESRLSRIEDRVSRIESRLQL